MRISLEKAFEILNEWRTAGQSISVTVSGGGSGACGVSFLRCSGKISKVVSNGVVLSWGNDTLLRVSLTRKLEMSEAGVLRLVFADGEVVMLTEALT